MGWHVVPVVLLLAAASGHGAGGTPRACTVTGFSLVQTTLGGGALQLLPQGGRTGCFGAYPFLGVSASRLGYPPQTQDRYGELAAALRRWSPQDGTPAVDQWVRWSGTVSAGMRAAGIDPVRLLQWIDGSDAAVAGNAQGGGAASLWPPFLPRARVTNPAETVSATPLPPGLPTSTTPAAGSPEVVRAAPPPADGAPTTPAAPPARRPPATVTWDGTRVPCTVAPACRTRLAAWRALPRWRRLVAGVSAMGWGIALLGALVGGLGATALLRRRQTSWQRG